MAVKKLSKTVRVDREALEAVHEIAEKMSNLCFYISRHPGSRDSDKATGGKLYRESDRAIKALFESIKTK